MRVIQYICNGCGKTLNPKLVIKLNVNIQRGVDPVKKETFDFCSPCFLKAKQAFLGSMSSEEQTDEEVSDAAVPIITEDVPEQTPTAEVCEQPDAPAEDVTEPACDVPVAEEINTDTEQSLVTGPISLEERAQILLLFVENGMAPEQIAKKMRRLPKGINRAINAARKSGELDKLRQTVSSNCADEEEDGPGRDSGSGVSNANITKDAYTAPPQVDFINGKRYDVGCILALNSAGWSPHEIANEKHYDEDVVRVIIEKYV